MRAKQRSNNVCTYAGMVILWTLVACVAMAGPQQTSPVATPSTEPFLLRRDGSSPVDERYRIGPGDLITISVFGRPELTREAVRVEGDGTVRMPLIDENIAAACRSSEELARDIAESYREYLKNPHVEVLVKEYSSESVSVVGAVMKPGNFQLQRRVRLRELLSLAGGPAANSGRSIQIIHDNTTLQCGPPDQNQFDTGVTSLDLPSVLAGAGNTNPYLRPGDLVHVPEADQVFVVGNVYKPSSLLLKQKITVSRAIALAGGTLPDTKYNRVRVIRQLPGDTSNMEITVDLRAIEKNQAEDLTLSAGDIVEVPIAQPKHALKAAFTAVLPTLALFPVYAVH